MSLLDQLKKEKRLSLDHWRYRLLHWTFNVKNVDIDDLNLTGLPMFLYTHYCPLFHLTNLIVILLPLILLVRAAIAVIKVSAFCLARVPWNKPFSMARTAVRKLGSVEKAASTPRRDVEVKRFLETLSNVGRRMEFSCSSSTFEAIWKNYGGDYQVLTEAEAEHLFNTYYPKVLKAIVRAKIRKEKLRAQIIMWTSISSVVIKWILNVGYVIAAGVVAYGCFVFFWPVLGWLGEVGKLIAWFFSNDGFLSLVVFVLKRCWCTSLYSPQGFTSFPEPSFLARLLIRGYWV